MACKYREMVLRGDVTMKDMIYREDVMNILKDTYVDWECEYYPEF